MKPSLEEYDALAEELAFLCARLNRLSCQLGNLTGVSKDPYKQAREAARHLDKCKSVTEDLMFSHYPDLPDSAKTIFYRKLNSSEATEANLKPGWQFK